MCEILAYVFLTIIAAGVAYALFWTVLFNWDSICKAARVLGYVWAVASLLMVAGLTCYILLRT